MCFAVLGCLQTHIAGCVFFSDHKKKGRWLLFSQTTSPTMSRSVDTPTRCGGVSFGLCRSATAEAADAQREHYRRLLLGLDPPDDAATFASLSADRRRAVLRVPPSGDRPHGGGPCRRRTCSRAARSPSSG